MTSNVPDLIEQGKVVPVAVPRYDPEAQAVAKAAGAYQHGEPLPWYVISKSADLQKVRRWLPRKFRPGLKGMPLEPKMIPHRMFGVNLRAILGAGKWSELTREVGRRSGSICQVCGERPIGPNGEWELHCHEDWEWKVDPDVGMQRLKALACICVKCHQAIHFGRAMTNGRGKEAFMHLMKTNCMTANEVKAMTDVAWEELDALNEVPAWALDLSELGRHYGIFVNVSPADIIDLREDYAEEQDQLRAMVQDPYRQAAIDKAMQDMETAQRPTFVN